MTQPRDSDKPIDICANCASFIFEDPHESDMGTCENAASDHYKHVLGCEHPNCERATERK